MDVEPDAALTGLSGGTCFDFNRANEAIFVVGTEEGKVRKCSRAYNSEYLETYEGHYMPVYSVQWNRWHPGVFLTASADWTVKLWEQTLRRPLVSFDLGSTVWEAVWAPYSSTVFAAVTADGKACEPIRSTPPPPHPCPLSPFSSGSALLRKLPRANGAPWSSDISGE